MIIEEELILAPDFLSFMQQCLKILDSDPTLLSVSGWNYNGNYSNIILFKQILPNINIYQP